MSRSDNADPLIKVMDSAQRFTSELPLSSYEKAKETLTACNAFSEPDEGRLRMPHSLHEGSAPANKGDAGSSVG